MADHSACLTRLYCPMMRCLLVQQAVNTRRRRCNHYSHQHTPLSLHTTTTQNSRFSTLVLEQLRQLLRTLHEIRSNTLDVRIVILRWTTRHRIDSLPNAPEPQREHLRSQSQKYHLRLRLCQFHHRREATARLTCNNCSVLLAIVLGESWKAVEDAFRIDCLSCSSHWFSSL